MEVGGEGDERSLIVDGEEGGLGTADTGVSRCLARNGVGEDLWKDGERVRGGFVELRGCSVDDGPGTAGTASRRRDDGREGTAGTGSNSREENLGWSAC